MHGKSDAGITSHDNRRLIPAPEAWQQLSISERQFRRLTKDKVIKSVRQGRKVYVPREEIDAYIQRLAEEAA